MNENKNPKLWELEEDLSMEQASRVGVSRLDSWQRGSTHTSLLEGRFHVAANNLELQQRDVIAPKKTVPPPP